MPQGAEASLAGRNDWTVYFVNHNLVACAGALLPLLMRLLNLNPKRNLACLPACVHFP